MDVVATLLNPWVLIYLAVVVGAQVLLLRRRQRAAAALAARRADAGLPPDVLMSHSVRLETLRHDALVEAAVLLGAVVVTPFALWLVASLIGLLPGLGEIARDSRTGLATAFLVLLVWALFTNGEMGKAFVSGVAFRTLVAFAKPFQVGDRVTLKGHGGKVVDIGPFLIKLQTPDDDQVSIPTHTLWSETLVSANAGDRASLCVMPFHLAPFATRAERQLAEDTIWDAIQASAYFDFTKPLQIYLEQRENAIVLTAKAYVASTYDEPLFKSDVTRAFLDTADAERIPLASAAWRRAPSTAAREPVT